MIAGALLVIGALLAPAGASVAAAAEIAPGDSVYIGSKEGYSGTGIFPIWSEGIQAGDPDLWAYCLENQVSALTGLVGTVGVGGDFLGSNYFVDPAVQGKVRWVLAHSYPVVSLPDLAAAAGVAQISRNDAIEATQYAIWRYTDLTFDAAWAWETPDSEAAYWYLVNGANANPGLTQADFEVTATVTAPGAAQTAGTLVGPFVVNTNRTSVAVTVDPTVAVTDVDGTAVDLNAVADGQELYLDLRGSTAAGSATVRVTAEGSSSTGMVVSVPNVPGGTPTAEDHAQSIILVAPEGTQTTGAATVEWAALPGAAEPVIGTSLVDAADEDHTLAAGGGTLIDTIAYRNLTPGTEYTVTGVLMDKANGQPTDIIGSTTFTPTAPDGSVDVSFSVTAEFAGTVLVAFEKLFVGTETIGEPVAVHTDIDDSAQTVAVEAENAGVPTTSVPGGRATLAATGSSAPIAGAAAALLAVVAGAVLMMARRRRLDA